MPTPYRRRWFQFSLVTLLTVVVVLAVLLAWVAKERRQSQYEQLVATQLKEQGCIYLQLGGPYETLARRVDETPGWWSEFARPILGERILSVQASPKLSDVKSFARLTRIEGLNLNDTQVMDLTPLAGLKSLKWIGILRTPVSQEQYESLQAALPGCQIEFTPSP